MPLHNEEEARAYVAARCSSGAMASLDHFVQSLAIANTTQNLVAAGTLPSVWLRHIADSAQLLDLVSRETGTWLDLGSGAGLPGIVVAVMRPERDVVLIEARRLRAQWLEAIIGQLGLTKCHVVGADIRTANTIEAAVISARAFAPMHRLVQLSARFSTNSTEWVLPKGRSAAQDIAQLPKSLQARFHVKQSVTDPDAGIVVGRGRVAP